MVSCSQANWEVSHLKRKNVPPNKKKLLIGAVSAVTVTAIIAGVAFFGRGSSEPVNVFPFQYLGMTEYWGDQQESYGPVSTDKVQTVFLSDTQTVTKIHVQQGDSIKKGDLLMTYDTTLTDITLERKRLSVEMLKLQQKEAQTRLQELRSMKPMTEPDEEAQPSEPDLGESLTAQYVISENKDYDGSSEEKSLIVWMQDVTGIDHLLLEELRLTAAEYQAPPVTPSPTPSITPAPSETPTVSETPAPSETPIVTETPAPSETPAVTETPAPSETPAVTETPAPSETPTVTETPAPTETPTVTETPASTETPTVTETPAPTETPTVTETPAPSETPTVTETPAPTETPTVTASPEIPPSPTVTPAVQVADYYVIFKVTENNMSLGIPTLWQGMHVYGDLERGFYFRFFDASAIPDHTLKQPEKDEEDFPMEDPMGSFTAAQLAQMRAEQEKRIHDLQLDIRMAEAEYKLMQLELDNGEIYAEIDGEAVSVLTEEEAKAAHQPLIKISDGGGFFVDGSVSELEKSNLQIGQEVTINDWNTGMEYIGQIQSVGDFPTTDDSWNGMGNPNASFYPFRVYIDGSADLQAGNYVNVRYSTSGAQNGIYLENPFILTESGNHYVYVMGENGRLEKRTVTAGKSLWGSYTQILSGITEEDLIAFPYGKNVKDGAPAVENDISALYEY